MVCLFHEAIGNLCILLINLMPASDHFPVTFIRACLCYKLFMEIIMVSGSLSVLGRYNEGVYHCLLGGLSHFG